MEENPDAAWDEENPTLRQQVIREVIGWLKSVKAPLPQPSELAEQPFVHLIDDDEAFQFGKELGSKMKQYAAHLNKFVSVVKLM